ncbi:MAG: hypothetical protein Q8P86_01955 [bacterium]|nr:hypothetical protein [bacterium]
MDLERALSQNQVGKDRRHVATNNVPAGISMTGINRVVLQMWFPKEMKFPEGFAFEAEDKRAKRPKERVTPSFKDLLQVSVSELEESLPTLDLEPEAVYLKEKERNKVIVVVFRKKATPPPANVFSFSPFVKELLVSTWNKASGYRNLDGSVAFVLSGKMKGNREPQLRLQLSSNGQDARITVAHCDWQPRG